MFRLVKWYGDCVADDGTTFIGYWARMRWGWFRITYTAILVHYPGRPGLSRYSLRRCEPPGPAGASIRWTAVPYGIQGHWEPTGSAIQALLPSASHDLLQWRCHGPRCRTRVSGPLIGRLEGLGYVEQLAISTTPWTLPFDELHWGRCLTATGSVIWIEWRGEEPVHLVWLNGEPQPHATLGRDHLQLDTARLQLCDPTPLRQGPLASTALAVIPGVGWWLPGRVRNAHEWKWLSRGQLHYDNGGSESGWAIHEIFRWA